MKTEDKSPGLNIPKVKVAVLGNENVGKSALTVRYLTRRYIGEYRSDTDLLYRQTVTVNNVQLEIEIIDVSGETRDCLLPTDQVQWADACLIVYSITDRKSFQFAQQALESLTKYRPLPVALLANKVDLEHLREVEESEGRNIAIHHGCNFYEISVAENSSDLYQSFENLVNDCRGLQLNNNNNSKPRKFSVSKMIGTLMGGNGKNGPPTASSQGGTVVVCSKTDLHRNCILKRRQNITASTSL